MNQKLKNKKGITLIALVVTIVVLLILAGVSINLILDNNGIIAKSKDAKAGTRASQVEDEIGLWEQNNFINSEAGQEQEDIDDLLASLISRKLLTEDEIDRERGIITIKKSDGTIIKEISYSNVKISISREPETTEKVGTVVFTIDSVEGIRKVNASQGESEIDNFISSLSEKQQKEMIKRSEHLCINKDMATNYTTFKEVLEFYKESGDILEATEEAFWDWVGNADDIAEWLKWNLDYVGFYDIEGNLVCCVVTNPDNEVSNTYRTYENGMYTFKIQDIITGKTYIKKVEVTNILVVEPENIDDWVYMEEDDGTISLWKYEGTETTVIIPNRINGKRVKEIAAPFGFWGATICSGNITYWLIQNTIKKVTISSGIEEITGKSFCCSKALEEIVLPNSIKTIGDYAFWNCENLKNITIPASVTNMGIGVFDSIPSITVNVPFKEGEQPSGWDTNWNQTNSDCTITVNYAK